MPMASRSHASVTRRSETACKSPSKVRITSPDIKNSPEKRAFIGLRGPWYGNATTATAVLRAAMRAAGVKRATESSDSAEKPWTISTQRFTSDPRGV